MMKGFLDKKDSFFSQEIEVVRHNLDTNIDTKIDQLNERVNKDIINNSKIIENDASNTEYVENEFVTEYKGDDKINETERSEASEDSQISKMKNRNKDNLSHDTTFATRSDLISDSSIYNSQSDLRRVDTMNESEHINKEKEVDDVPVYKQMKDAKYKLQKEINEAKRI